MTASARKLVTRYKENVLLNGGHVPIGHLYIDCDGMLQRLRFEGDAVHQCRNNPRPRDYDGKFCGRKWKGVVAGLEF